jgi:hypothetical protein
MCGWTYLIKIFWEKTDLAICNCGASVYNFWRETAERNFGFFTMPNKQISPEISSLFSLVKKPKFLSAVSDQILYTDDI